MFRSLIVVLIALALPLAAAGQQIQAVTGNVSNDSTLVVTGLDFGGGPNIVLYDNFEQGDPGDVVDMDAEIGSWFEYNNEHQARLEEDGFGNQCARLIYDDTLAQLRFLFDPAQEIFLTYRLRTPPGGYFPSYDTPDELPDGTLSSVNFKVAWLYDADADGDFRADDDIVLPSCGGSMFHYMSNDSDNTYDSIYWGSGPYLWKHDGGNAGRFYTVNGTRWNRWTSWLKAGDDPRVDNGIIYGNGMSEEFGQKPATITSHPLFTGGQNGLDRWTGLNLPGYHRNTAEGGVGHADQQFDDVYLAIGPNAAARIELGNRPDYASCTKLDIMTPVDWTENSIEVTARVAQFDLDEGAYLFVIGADNQPSDGFGVTVGRRVSDSAPVPINNRWRTEN